MDTDIVTALIAAGVSIFIWLLSIPFEPLKQKWTHLFRLRIEHKYEQRKEIKAVISKYKMQLIDSAESLNRRFENMHDHYDWLDVKGDYTEHNHYIHSFVYRLMSMLAWIQKIESEMIYLDITISDHEDLDFVKHLKLTKAMLCEAGIIKKNSAQYDVDHQSDHFFVDRLNSLLSFALNNGEVLSFMDFKNELTIEQVREMYQYLDGVNPVEKRYRWDLLQLVHYMTILLLNNYGYDYQYTDQAKLANLIQKQTTKKRLHAEFGHRLIEYGLSKNKEVARLIKLL